MSDEPFIARWRIRFMALIWSAFSPAVIWPSYCGTG